MDAFSSAASSSRSEGSEVSSAEVMQRLKLQLAQAFVEEFVETVSVKCFEKCVTKPGSSMSGGESSCISRCVDRYLEATNIVGKSLLNEPR